MNQQFATKTLMANYHQQQRAYNKTHAAYFKHYTLALSPQQLTFYVLTANPVSFTVFPTAS